MPLTYFGVSVTQVAGCFDFINGNFWIENSDIWRFICFVFSSALLYSLCLLIYMGSDIPVVNLIIALSMVRDNLQYRDYGLRLTVHHRKLWLKIMFLLSSLLFIDSCHGNAYYVKFTFSLLKQNLISKFQCFSQRWLHLERKFYQLWLDKFITQIFSALVFIK